MVMVHDILLYSLFLLATDSSEKNWFGVSKTKTVVKCTVNSLFITRGVATRTHVRTCIPEKMWKVQKKRTKRNKTKQHKDKTDGKLSNG